MTKTWYARYRAGMPGLRPVPVVKVVARGKGVCGRPLFQKRRTGDQRQQLGQDHRCEDIHVYETPTTYRA